MKKIIHKPNGEIVEVEGTPEEIAAYEKKLKENVSEQPIPKTPGLLTDEVKKLLKDLDTSGLKHVPAVQHYPRHTEWCELSVAGRGWWSIIPPRCTCGAEASFWRRSPLYPFWTTVTTTIETTDTTKPSDIEIPPAHVIEELERLRRQRDELPATMPLQLPLPPRVEREKEKKNGTVTEIEL